MSQAPKKAEKKDDDPDKKPEVLTEDDIKLLKKYGSGPYSETIKKLEEENKE
jgi:26S proteasome regulatory subunit T1